MVAFLSLIFLVQNHSCHLQSRQDLFFFLSVVSLSPPPLCKHSPSSFISFHFFLGSFVLIFLVSTDHITKRETCHSRDKLLFSGWCCLARAVSARDEASAQAGPRNTPVETADHSQSNFRATTFGSNSRDYLLTGQSCTPGIDTKNIQTVFEEQFVARTLEDTPVRERTRKHQSREFMAPFVRCP